MKIKAERIMIFENGNVAVFDGLGQQMTKYQGSLYDYKYADKLARKIVQDDPKVDEHKHFFPLHDFIKHYKKYPNLLKKKGDSK